MGNGKRVLVTGASGEMGHVLLPALRNAGWEVVALDLAAPAPELARHCLETVAASVADAGTLGELFARHHFDAVFHLAATLSSKAEKDPDFAHEINVDATVRLFRLCREDARATGRNVLFLFPSSIAVYGLPGREAKNAAGAVAEDEWLFPSGAYGIHKLHDEHLGAYYTARALREGEPGLDFRAIRFPGLISAETLPTGGTSDFAPEMIHAAAQGRPYPCFVSAETRIPFMTMPDAIDAFLRLANAPAQALTTRVYNIGAFNPSAEEIRREVLAHFPQARITFEPAGFRQAIVDTWPAGLDDRKARADWGHAPRHGLREAVADYLVPALLRRYATTGR
jgi:nucleoside-diphosphate-sugar epimerase